MSVTITLGISSLEITAEPSASNTSELIPRRNIAGVYPFKFQQRQVGNTDWVYPSDTITRITLYVVDGRKLNIELQDVTNQPTWNLGTLAAQQQAVADINAWLATAAPPVITVPDAPTSVSAVAGDNQATVSFTTPYDGGSPITGYTVTSSPGGITGTGVSSPIVVSGLSNGTAYTFTVIATNIVGNSAASSPSAAVTPTSTLLTGLTASYSFDGNSLKNVGAANGVDTNVTYAAGKFGQAAVFNGTGYVNVIDSSNFTFGTGDFSLSMYIKRSAIGTTQLFTGQAAASGVNSGTSISIRFQADNKIGFSVIFSDLSSNYVDTGIVITNTTNWYNLIFQRSGANLTVHLDGVLSYTGTSFFGTNTVNNATTQWGFGKIGEYPSLFLNGSIDEFNLWTGRTLTNTEITKLQTKFYPFV